MGDNAGDGNKGFFEGRAFNIFRDKEENAGAARDRAAKAQAQADYRTALAGLDEDTGASPEAAGMSAIRTPQGSSPLKDVAARRQVQRLKRALKAQDALNEAQTAEMAEIREHLKSVIDQLDRREEILGTGLSRALSVTGALAGVLNVGDAPTIPVALQAARALEAWDIMGWSNGSKMVKLVASALTILAYYDPKVGLSSLWTTRQVRRRGAAAPSSGLGNLGGLLGGTVGGGDQISF